MYEVSEAAKDAQDILNTWKENYELYYISARGENVSDVTVNWFKSQSIPYDHIELIGSHDKISVAKNMVLMHF